MPHPSPAAFIEATGLIKHLGGHLVLNGASLRLLEGETLAVLGRSGDGKSVLLKHLAGLMMPESGSVRIDGDEIVVLLFVKEIVEDGVIVGVVESVEDSIELDLLSILVVSNVGGIIGGLIGNQIETKK